MKRKMISEEWIKKTIKKVLLETFFVGGTIISLGSTGDNVRELQKVLGIYEDGKFGKQTKKCVEEFQDDFGLDVDGKVGYQTSKKIQKLIDGEIEWDSPSFCKVSPSKYKSTDDEKQKKTIGSGKHIVIGDSQTPYVDNASDMVSRISSSPGQSSLWEGGKTVSWLINSLEKYPVDDSVESVVLCIGTNGGFGKFINDNIPKLISLVESTFPNANIYAVQGSWGWGGLKNITEKQVKDYYKKYKDLGVTIVEPPIGKIEPHGNKPIYKVIGKELDKLLQ
jgi:hypothetical protein